MLTLALLTIVAAGIWWGASRARRGPREVFVYTTRPRTPILRTTALAAAITAAQYGVTTWLPGTLPGLLALAGPAWFAARTFIAPKVTGTPVSGIYVDRRDHR